MATSWQFLLWKLFIGRPWGSSMTRTGVGLALLRSGLHLVRQELHKLVLPLQHVRCDAANHVSGRCFSDVKAKQGLREKLTTAKCTKSREDLYARGVLYLGAYGRLANDSGLAAEASTICAAVIDWHACCLADSMPTVQYDWVVQELRAGATLKVMRRPSG